MIKSVTITYLDEIRCLFSGISPDHMRSLWTKYGVLEPKYFFKPNYKLGRWDGKRRFFSDTGITFIILIPEIIKILERLGYTNFAVKDKRKTYSIEFKPVDENYFVDYDITLAQHQVEAVNSILDNYGGVIRAGTGAGKTIITAALCDVFNKQNLLTIVVVPNYDLVTQTINTFKRCGVDVGEFSGREKNVECLNVVTTWQALQNNPDILKLFKVFILDECFHPDTKVLTIDGWKPIKSLQVGNKIINYCETTKTFKEDVIEKVHENLVKSSFEDMYEVTFDNGASVKVTGNHEFLTSNRGWVRCDELTEIDDIIALS